MTYLIRWKLEKLLERRDFGEIMLKQPVKITLKSSHKRNAQT